MKSLITTIFITMATLMSANDKTQLTQLYEIVSDTVNKDVPAGKCLISGTVYHLGKTINEATIFSENTKQVNSDKLGRFKILVDTADTYLIIQKANIPEGYVEYYKFQNQHHITLKVFMPTADAMIMVDKPVIYLYSKEQKDVKVNITPKGDFTFTYPSIIDNNWTGSVDGNEIDVNGKKYPYLFYETQMSNLDFESKGNSLKGSVVSKENIIEFLEASLSQLNFNTQETTDFITYWGPKMIEHEKVFIQFWIDESYDQIATIAITPKPDNMGRVFMVYSKIEDGTKIECENQVLPKINREGFTVIEWGGSELPKQRLYKLKTL